MLTTLESNFVQEYKACGSAVKALRAAGYKAKSDNYARVKAHRIINKPEIKSILERHSDNLDNALVTPVITKIVTPDNVKTITLPTRDEYAQKALERSSDESKLKEETKYKYYDLAGRVLNHVRNDEAKSDGDTINIICREMNLSIASAPDLIQRLNAEKEALIKNQTGHSVIDVTPSVSNTVNTVPVVTGSTTTTVSPASAETNPIETKSK